MAPQRDAGSCWRSRWDFWLVWFWGERPVSFRQDRQPLRLFEKNARPLFAEKCQGCHNAKLKSGGIDFSSPSAIKEAASTGIFGNAAEPEKSPIVKALSYEGQIKMPPQETSWAERFTMFTDQFGINWMINCEKPMQQ